MKCAPTWRLTGLSLMLLAAWSSAACGQEDSGSKPEGPAHVAHYAPEKLDEWLAQVTTWCLRMQDRYGAWGSKTDRDRGTAARPYVDEMWGLFVLGHADNSPAVAEAIGKGLTRACRADVEGKTTTTAIRILALSRVYPRLDRAEAAELKQVRADYDFLVAAQNSDGGWPAEKGGGSAVVYTYWPIPALCEAERMLGVSPKDRKSLAMWQSAVQYCTGQQEASGAYLYNYRGTPVPYPNVTAMMLAALVAMRGHVTGGQGCAGSDRRLPDLDEALDRGLKWLDQNYQVDCHALGGFDWRRNLWHYGIERTAGPLGVRRLNGLDYAGETAAAYIKAWWLLNAASVMEYVALAVGSIYPVRGECLVNKLEFPGSWSREPCDAAHLVDYVSAARGERMRCRVVDASDESIKMEWPTAPILYIAGDAPVLPPEKLSVEEKEAWRKAFYESLRAFTDGGGLVFFDAEKAGSKTFLWWRDTVCKEAWPEWKPEDLGRNRQHPLWSSDVRIPKPPGQMWAIDDGLRTHVVMSCRDAAAAWCHGDPKDRDRPAMMDLGRNFCACVTDGMALAEWRALRDAAPGSKYAEQNAGLVPGPRRKIAVARITHDGEQGLLGRNYGTWDRLAEHVNQVLVAPQRVAEEATGAAPGPPPLSLREIDPVTPGTEFDYEGNRQGQENPPPLPPEVLYLCGRNACTLDADAAKWLRQYLSRGGFLLAEATLGDPAFAEKLMGFLAGKESDGCVGLTVVRLSEALKESGLAENPVVDGKGFPSRDEEGTEPRGYNARKVAFTRSLSAELADKAAKARAEAEAAENTLLAKAAATDKTLEKHVKLIHKARQVARLPDDKLVKAIDDAPELGIVGSTIEAEKAHNAVLAARAKLGDKRKEWDEELRRVKTAGHEADQGYHA